MKSRRTYENVGRSTDAGPLGQRQNLKGADITGLIACQLTGPDIFNRTVIYVHPDRMEPTRQKYAQRGQMLTAGKPNGSELPCGPFVGRTVALPDEPASPEPKRRGRTPRPVMCRQNGVRYESLRAASAALGVDISQLRKHLKGECPRVKGYTFSQGDGET